MEIIIAIAVFGFGLWWVFLRKSINTMPPAHEEKTEHVVATGEILPVVSPTITETPTPPQVIESVVELAPAVVAATVVVEATPVKKPRKPRAPKVVAPVAKPAVKKAAPVKKAAAIKAAPKKPTTPRSKKA